MTRAESVQTISLGSLRYFLRSLPQYVPDSNLSPFRQSSKSRRTLSAPHQQTLFSQTFNHVDTGSQTLDVEHGIPQPRMHPNKPLLALSRPRTWVNHIIRSRSQTSLKVRTEIAPPSLARNVCIVSRSNNTDGLASPVNHVAEVVSEILELFGRVLEGR